MFSTGKNSVPNYNFTQKTLMPIIKVCRGINRVENNRKHYPMC